MKKRLLITLAAAALALPAAAADAPKAETGLQLHAELMREHGENMRAWAEQFASDMQSSMTYMFSDRVGRGKVVKGAPYSAEVVTESRQTLSDGNVISQKRSSRVFRDNDGRTRQESYRDDKLRSVYISDPVAGTSYTLLPGSKIAVSLPRFDHLLAPRARKEKTGSDTPSAEKESKEVRVQILRIGDGEGKEIHIAPLAPMPPTPPAGVTVPVPPTPPLPPIPGVHTMRFESTAALGKGVTTNLGTRDFDGVKAEGKSTQWTIPAGHIGNRNPIAITSESWYSHELQVTVYSRYNDPRAGESIYQLAGIKRAEPSADLFRVPEDYKLRGRREKGEAPEAKR